MKKFWKNDCDIDDGSRFCKKCGCELVSTNKKRLCANCLRETGKGIRDKMLSGLLFVGGIVTLGLLSSDDSNDNTID